MRCLSIPQKNNLFHPFPIPRPQNFQPLSHPVRRIAQNPVEPPPCLQRAICQIRNPDIQEPPFEPILLEIRLYIPFPVLAPECATVDVAPCYVGAEMCCCDEETPGAHEGVVD